MRRHRWSFAELATAIFAADILGELGFECLSSGKDQKAADYLEEAIEIFKQNGDQRKEAMTLLSWD